MFTKNFFQNLFKLFKILGKKNTIKIIILQILSLFSSIVDAFSIGATLPFLSILSNPNYILLNKKATHYLSFINITTSDKLIFYITFIYVIILFTSALLKWLLFYFNNKVNNTVGSYLGYLLYKYTLYKPYTYHTTNNSSDIIAGITKASEIINLIINPFFLIINSLFTIIFLTLTLIILNPKVILITLLLLTLCYIIVMYLVKDKLKKEANRINDMRPILLKTMQEGLGGIRDILLDGLQEVFSEIYKKNESKMRRSVSNISLISMTPNIVIQTIGIITITIMASLVASNDSGNNSLQNGLPFFGALAFAYLRISPAIQQIYTSWTNINNGSPAIEYVVNFLDQDLPNFAKIKLNEQISFEKSISFENVSFRYNDSTKYILENISIKIPKGSRVGIVGKTGEGKSTLLDIIMNLLYPTSGHIRIDDTILNINNFRSWQKHISHVPQSIYLSDSSIAENIAFGVNKNNINFELLKNSADKAMILETINQLSQKFETKIGERGVRLSGGQRQRIGIARALYKQSNVIIFDEATSALDSNTESEVMNAINKLDKNLTLIIVAHRLSTLKECDIIFEVENGKIISYNNFEYFSLK
jgi:ABC-type multidrug transport system fused ATPase/permease subunit